MGFLPLVMLVEMKHRLRTHSRISTKKLGDRIPHNQQQQIGFNVIFVEHTMCKITRMDTVKWRNIYEKKGGKGMAMVGKGGSGMKKG